ncbi:MAG: hypothetical protein GY841_13100 [FCB group bacterium]|nr:hypothetical protein [FCB group bacterium]
MAAQETNILNGIETRLAAYTVSGQTLEDIRSYWVQRTENDMPPDFGKSFPALRVRMLPVDGEIVSIPACMTRKRCPVEYQVYTSQAGYMRDKTASELIDLVEDVFYQQQLGISNLLIHFTGKNYTLPSEIPFAAQLHGGAALNYTYEYTDVRATP